MDITLSEIYEARNLIKNLTKNTPLYKSKYLSNDKTDIYYKLEFLQDTRSFKVRGAANFALHLDDRELNNGLITYSTGNHGRATAHVAKKLGTDAKICISKNVLNNKIEGIKKSGGDVIIYGNSQDQAKEKAVKLSETEGRAVVPPFDNKYIICGQGTIGLEILEKLPNLDSILIPLSGGGLISGISYLVKSFNPECKVYGISMKKGAAMYESIQKDKPVLVDEVDSLADSLQGGILLDNKYTFKMVQRYVDQIVLVTEKEIKDAMIFAFEKEHFVLEGAAAVSIAALLADKISYLGEKSAFVLTGSNVDNDSFLRTIDSK
ncbi:MAG: pyridoxal-phosphate dependent enzyme [Halanaerobiales bacterium]|nr:pyridoxal-phosphate dependent enzyme [Halanaerobiales bacterium]